MRTAMQQMIDYLQSGDVQQTITTQWHLAKARELLKIEEEQIKKAFDKLPLVCGDTCDTSDEYYLLYKVI